MNTKRANRPSVQAVVRWCVGMAILLLMHIPLWIVDALSAFTQWFYRHIGSHCYIRDMWDHRPWKHTPNRELDR